MGSPKDRHVVRAVIRDVDLLVLSVVGSPVGVGPHGDAAHVGRSVEEGDGIRRVARDIHEAGRRVEPAPFGIVGNGDARDRVGPVDDRDAVRVVVRHVDVAVLSVVDRPERFSLDVHGRIDASDRRGRERGGVGRQRTPGTRRLEGPSPQLIERSFVVPARGLERAREVGSRGAAGARRRGGRHHHHREQPHDGEETSRAGVAYGPRSHAHSSGIPGV